MAQIDELREAPISIYSEYEDNEDKHLQSGTSTGAHEDPIMFTIKHFDGDEELDRMNDNGSEGNTKFRSRRSKKHETGNSEVKPSESSVTQNKTKTMYIDKGALDRMTCRSHDDCNNKESGEGVCDVSVSPHGNCSYCDRTGHTPMCLPGVSVPTIIISKLHMSLYAMRMIVIVRPPSQI